MKNICILIIAVICLCSCGSNKYLVKETNLNLCDQELNARGIDTLSIVGTYASVNKDFLAYFEPDFSQNEKVEGGVLKQTNKLSGDFLLVPSRFFVTDKKGRKVLKENDTPLTAPSLYEITGVTPGTQSRYTSIDYTVESDSGTSATFVYIPVSTTSSLSVRTTRVNNSGGIRVPNLGNSQRNTRVYRKEILDENGCLVRYQLMTVRCGDCNKDELLQSGFKVDENDFIYFLYEGRKYVVSMTRDGRQAFVDAANADVQLDGIFYELENDDNRNRSVAKTKRIGQ